MLCKLMIIWWYLNYILTSTHPVDVLSIFSQKLMQRKFRFWKNINGIKILSKMNLPILNTLNMHQYRNLKKIEGEF